MPVLAIDTATSICSVAVAQGQKLLAEASTNMPQMQSQRLLPMVQGLLTEVGLRLQDLDLLAVARGPGSFTGLRIGIAAVKGLGLALELPVVGISTLLALAHNFNSGLVCPVLDARLGQVYAALYRAGEIIPRNLFPDQAIAVPALLSVLKEYDEPIWFCGDGVEQVFPFVHRELAAPRRAHPHLGGNRAGALAALARQLPSADPDALAPSYLRDSQAEVQLRQRLGQNER